MIEPQLSWNPLVDLRMVLEFPFMVNAFRAGAIVAALAGVIGWFMVLRRQTFAGHTLAVVGFPGASGAVLVGLPAGCGLFGFALVAALLIGVRFQPFDCGRRNWASRRPPGSSPRRGRRPTRTPWRTRGARG